MTTPTPSQQGNTTLTFPPGALSQDILMFFHFAKDASGSLKITSIVEYVDSFKVNELKAKMAGLFSPSSDS